MQIITQPSARRSFSLRLLAFVCLVLTSVSMSVEAAHFHADNSASSSKNCPICISAHHTKATAPAAVASATLVPLVAVAAMLPCEPLISRQEALLFFVRPPPAV
jgi:hypothetical protein